jgi:predicted  nucleic acid-binding Zn-ribbon protein
MPELGKKYNCYSCHTKFYDLGKPVPVCPKCGADQRDADDKPAAPTPRSRPRVVEEPIEEPDFAAESEAVPDEEEEDIIEGTPAREETDEEEEEEEF